MSQNDLKPGDTCDVLVAGKTLICEPIPFGRLKKLAKLVFGSVEEISAWEPASVMKKMPDLFDEKIEEFCKLAFDPNKHAFMNKEWIDENMSLVMIRSIIDKIVKINGLQDFLGKAGARMATPAQAEARPMEMRPLEELKK